MSFLLFCSTPAKKSKEKSEQKGDQTNLDDVVVGVTKKKREPGPFLNRIWPFLSHLLMHK